MFEKRAAGAEIERTALRAPFPERGPVKKVPELWGIWVWGIWVTRAAGDQLSCKA
jgi:hypothetical protein